MAHETIFANGVRFREVALSSLIKHTAAAPSLMPDAFPADTLPSFLKTGLSLLIASKVEPCLGNSSDEISILSFFLSYFTGMISFLNLEFFCAYSALFWDSVAN